MKITSNRVFIYMIPLASLFVTFILLLVFPSGASKWFIIIMPNLIAGVVCYMFMGANVKVVGSLLQVCIYNQVSSQVDLYDVERIDITYNKSGSSTDVGVRIQVKGLNFINNNEILLSFSKEMNKDKDVSKLIDFCQQVNPRIEVDLSHSFFKIDNRKSF